MLATPSNAPRQFWAITMLPRCFSSRPRDSIATSRRRRRCSRGSESWSISSPGSERLGFGPNSSEPYVGQRTLRFHIRRDADFPPALRLLRARGLGQAGVFNGIAAEQKVRGQMFAVSQTQYEL